MSLTLDGTNGINSPSFTPTSSTVPLSGQYLPSANTLGFVTASIERLRIDVSGNLGIGTSSPVSKLHIDPGTAMTTSGNAYGGYIANTSLKTYPSTSAFAVYPGFYQNIEVGTSQTIDTTTPGGFNFVYGINNFLTKSAGSTSDIERLYFTGIQNRMEWRDLNTCKQYIGLTDILSYWGIDANGRISSSFNAQSVTLTAPAGGTQTISSIATGSLLIRNVNANITYNITSATGYNPPTIAFSGTAGNITATVGSYTAFGMNTNWGSSLSGASSSATITNFYGLRLPPPSTATNLTITSRWGVYADDPLANNYFAGNVGIGVTPSAWNTSNSVRALQLNACSLWSYSTTYLFLGQNYYYNTSGNRVYSTTAPATEYQQSSGNHAWLTAASGTAGNAISFTQAMTLTASGELLVGSTNTIGSCKASVLFTNGTNNGFAVYDVASSGTANMVLFYRGGSQVGSITSTSSTTAFNPSSDISLKENIKPITNGLERVAKLKPVDYNWKSDGVLDNGFIAQDLLATEEFAHRCNSIETKEDGTKVYGVDYMKFVAVLTAAIQELSAEIETLKQRI